MKRLAQTLVLLYMLIVLLYTVNGLLLEAKGKVGCVDLRVVAMCVTVK